MSQQDSYVAISIEFSYSEYTRYISTKPNSTQPVRLLICNVFTDKIQGQPSCGVASWQATSKAWVRRNAKWIEISNSTSNHRQHQTRNTLSNTTPSPTQPPLQHNPPLHDNTSIVKFSSFPFYLFMFSFPSSFFRFSNFPFRFPLTVSSFQFFSFSVAQFTVFQLSIPVVQYPVVQSVVVHFSVYSFPFPVVQFPNYKCFASSLIPVPPPPERHPCQFGVLPTTIRSEQMSPQ